MLPKDSIMLLSYVNTQLRDYYSSLDAMCSTLDINKEELITKLKEIDYEYTDSVNQFK